MQTFKKQERLCKRKSIQQLLTSASSLYIYPLKITWHEMSVETDYPVQILISVSKRSFRKAFIRNKIKRRIREAYRKNKEELYAFLRKKDKQYALMIGYKGKEMLSYTDIEQKVILGMHLLQKKL